MKRIHKAHDLLREHSLDALLIDNPIDLFYLTRLSLSTGRLLLSENEATLFVDGRYYDEAKKSFPSVIETRGFGHGTGFAKEWKFSHKRVGFDAAYTSYDAYLELQALEANLVPLKSPIKRVREIKEPEEIEALKRAAELGARGYDYVLDLLKEGVSEEEIALQLEIFWKKMGGMRLSFHPHICFGENSAYPHYVPSSRQLQKGDTVLIDIGVVKDHYHSDMTRVVFYGEPTGEIEKIYRVVQTAQEKALQQCRPGVTLGSLDQTARAFITEKGYGPYFVHSLGHGVGLEIHEFPTVRSQGEDALRPLQPGMVITIEPGIYLPKLGGVRLEDTIVITQEGYENLTKRPLSLSLPVL